MAETKWTPGPPPKISDIDAAFPARAMDWLPPWDDIPREFKSGMNPWARQVGQWFFRGPDRAWIERLAPKNGIEKNEALRVAQACLGSFAPKHEHKTAGVAYLLALWLDDPEAARARGEDKP